MGKHLSKYQTEEDYNNNEDTHVKPHISYIVNPTKKMIYIPKPYIEQYFTIEALEDGLTVKLSNNACEYRIDDGDWISLAEYSATAAINSGQKISFKITNPTLISYGVGTFKVNKEFNVEGNIMSLLYGDDFIGQKDLSGKNFVFCYLLENCTTLQNAKNLILPATTLANDCYNGMFQNCTGLTTAPELPATALAKGCYEYMFSGCSKLNKITMLATDISASYCLNNWVNGVARSGTFVKHPDMTSLPSGNSGIPSGWTVEDYNEDYKEKIDYSKEYFTIEALEDDLTVKLSLNTCEYRIDNGKWISLAANTTSPSINSGQKISFKITNPIIFMFIGKFTVNKSFNVEGNIMSLLYGDDFIGQFDLSEKSHAFKELFNQCTTLKNSKNLILPATILGSYCYYDMFYGCTSLTSAPELPAITLAERCYSGIFNGCSKLNKITMLATDISASYCLNNWVKGVASTGTFVKHPDMASLPSGVNGIPTGWAVEDYNEDYNESNLITFTIDGTEYQAEEGMTWEEWVNSEYNTIQYIICGDGYVKDQNRNLHTLYIPGQSNATMGSGPRKNDIIENGQIYKNASIGEPCLDGV